MKPDIIAITETKLNKDIEDATIFSRGYEVTRRERVGRNGGGIALLIREGLRSEEVSISVQSGFQEFLVRYIKTGTVGIIVAVIYNPPRNIERPEEYELNNEGIIDILNRVAQMAIDKGSRLLVMGDFNHREINWEKLDPQGDSQSWRARFLDCVQGNFLHQHVIEATRARGSDTPSILDLIITQSKLDVENMLYRPPLGKSDHCVLSMDFVIEDDIPEGSNPGKERRLNYQKGNYERLSHYFGNIDWDTELENKSMQQVYDRFCQKYEEGVAECIPTTRIGLEKGIKKWFNKDCQKAKKERDVKWKRYRRHKGEAAWGRYTVARNRYLDVRRQAERQFEQDIAKKAKENPKLFHNFIRGKLKVKEQVVKLQRDKGGYTETDEQICEEFNKAFQTVFTVEDTPVPQIVQEVDGGAVEDIIITVGEVKRLLKELDPHKAAGPDKIATFVLKECADQLAIPLTFIFQKSLLTGEVPIEWRIADVIPIFKMKGRRDRALNYRPVSLTSVVCKVMEKIVRRKILSHLERIGFLTNGQHGFREGRSTVTNLLEFYDRVSEIMQERDGWVDCIYLDFQKAFDSVPHDRLIAKLDKMAGVRGRVLKWIIAYLKGRWQRVKVRGAVSDLSRVTSGVPQGSVLGPLLFLIYINDLPEGIKSFMSMFADDAKILKRIEGEENCRELQRDLDRVNQWSEKWLMKFNTSKCKVMKMGRSKHRPDFEYSLAGGKLENSDGERDLGVVIMPDLSPEKHIAAVVRSAYALLANIRVAFKYLDKETFKIIYLTYVRPKLEYAAPLWNPHLKKHITKLEKVQKHATKMVPELRELSYTERLRELGLPTLQSRRERGDMITVYRFLKGFDRINSQQFFDCGKSRTRGHNMKIRMRVARRDVRKHFFSHRVVENWNSLNKEVVSARSIHSFKEKYDKLQQSRSMSR